MTAPTVSPCAQCGQAGVHQPGCAYETVEGPSLAERAVAAAANAEIEALASEERRRRESHGPARTHLQEQLACLVGPTFDPEMLAFNIDADLPEGRAEAYYQGLRFAMHGHSSPLQLLRPCRRCGKDIVASLGRWSTISSLGLVLGVAPEHDVDCLAPAEGEMGAPPAVMRPIPEPSPAQVLLLALTEFVDDRIERATGARA